MQLHKVRFRAMGSPCSIQLYAPTQAQAETQANLAIGEVERLEQAYSRYLPTSILSKINQHAGGEALDLDAESAAIMDYAFAAWQQSEGLFDVTSGVLRKAWDFRQKKIPSQKTIDELLPLIGMDILEWQNPKLRLPKTGMELDFGGCVKEYAADAAAQIVLDSGIEHGIVELGGDIRIVGPAPDGSSWPVAIRNPSNATEILTRVGLNEGALASSGDYERFTEVNGRRYSHILNPKTGWPVSPPASVSVIAPSCLIAGTICTVAMLKGEAEALTWLNSVELPYVLVYQNGKVVNCF